MGGWVGEAGGLRGLGGRGAGGALGGGLGTAGIKQQARYKQGIGNCKKCRSK